MRYLVYFLGLLVLGSSILLAQAQPLPAPLNLKAKFNPEELQVELSWDRPSSELKPMFYVVFRAVIFDTSAVDTSDTTGLRFIKIGRSKEEEFEDHLTFMLPRPDKLIYFVVAVYEGMRRSPRSNFAVVDLSSVSLGSYVFIISRPPRYAVVGKLYEYQVRAVSTSAASVISGIDTSIFRFYLREAPEGMTIDSVSGLIQWVPESPGKYEVEVIAVDTSGAEGEQEFKIIVVGVAGVVTGSVTDESGNPMGRVLIKLYQKSPHHNKYRAITDSTGRFTIEHVDSGSYYARAVPIDNENYYPVWYDGVRIRKQATLINVGGDTVEINFKLIPKPPEDTTMYVVSGRVVDTSGVAISKAFVLFIKAKASLKKVADPEEDEEEEEQEDWEDFMEHMQEKEEEDTTGGMFWFRARNWISSRMREHLEFAVVTDDSGYYKAKVKPEAYIVLSLAEGYILQFWDKKENILEADILEVRGDTSGINFELVPEPLTFNVISGQVTDTSGVPVASRMIAFGRRALEKRHKVARTVETDSLGFYKFENLPDGCYIILALPYGKYVPTFYTAMGGTIKWKEADTICVANGSVRDGFNIQVLPSEEGNGLARITGFVTSGGAGLNGVLIFVSSTGTSPSGRFAKVSVSDQFAGYAITNSDGYYTVSNLTPGTYTVTVGKIDYEEESATVTIADYSTADVQDTTVNFDVSETPTSVEVDPGVIPDRYYLYPNYPNPFNPRTKIRYTIPERQFVSIKVYNILGQEIATLVERVQDAGDYTITFDASNLPSGVYFYRLKAGEFVSVRKMLLIK
jgi:hypothetical protein